MAPIYTLLVAAVVTAACTAPSRTTDEPSPVRDALPAARVAPAGAGELGQEPTSPAAHHRDTPVALSPDASTLREVIIPEGTTLRLQLAAALSPIDTAREDVIRATLLEPITVAGEAIVPAGATVTGRVNESAGFPEDDAAEVGVRLDALRIGRTRHPLRSASIARAVSADERVGAADDSGTAVVAAPTGHEVSLTPGTVVSARLTRPVAIRVH